MVVENHKHNSNNIPSQIILHHKHKITPPITTTNHPSPPRQPPSVDSYTSLKDILPPPPSSILSPTPAATLPGLSPSSSGSGSGHEISIRNRLVKQAAWAYLQPAVVSSSPSSSSQRLCFSGEVFRPVFDEIRRGVVETVGRVYDWLVDALWLILCR